MRFMAVLMSAALVACGVPESGTLPLEPDNRAALALKIEKAVGKALPEVIVGQYARYYAESADGRVRALYAHICKNGESTCAEAKAIWTSLDKLPPPVMDGGCIVVRVEYDLADDKLIGASCNGLA